MKVKKIKEILSKGLTMSINDTSSGSGTIELVDANNKKFSLSIGDVTRIVEDAETDFTGIQDNESPIMTSYEMKVVDSEGKDFNITDAIKDIESGSGEITAIDVLFEATHSGITANDFTYNSQDLEDGVPTWLTPFKKPLLKNHNMDCEPIGRVVDAYFGPSEIADGKDTINTVFRVTDKDAMVKFMDKRYNTVSIGASAGNIRCNLCGKDILKDGKFKFCGHWRGEHYKDEKATWTASKFDYKECSVVNNPADRFAQVKKITVIKKDSSAQDSDAKNNIVGDEADKPNNLNDSDINDALLNNIDDAVNSDEGIVQDKDNVQEEANDDATNPEIDITDSVTIEDKYSKALADLEDKDSKIKDLEALVEDEKSKNESYKEEFTAIKNENVENKKNFTTVSLLYKGSLIDHIITKKLANKSLNLDLVDEEKTALLSKSTKELLSLIDETQLEESNTNSNVPHVTSPGLVDNNTGNVVEDDKDDVDKVNDVENKKKTLADIEKEFLENL